MFMFINNHFYQWFRSFTSKTAWFCNTKSRVFHGVSKNTAEDEEALIAKSNSHKKKWLLYLAIASRNFPPYLLLYSWYSTQNITFCITKPCFCFLLLMEPVCSCSIVSIHFIVLSDLSPTHSPKLHHFIASMSFAFTTIFIFLLLCCLLQWISSLYSYTVLS